MKRSIKRMNSIKPLRNFRLRKKREKFPEKSEEKKEEVSPGQLELPDINKTPVVEKLDNEEMKTLLKKSASNDNFSKLPGLTDSSLGLAKLKHRKKVISRKYIRSNKERKGYIKQYFYYLGNGNNSELIKRVMEKRPYWEETSDSSPLLNFKWQQTTKGVNWSAYIDRMSNIIKRSVNHFEFKYQISTKDNLLKNLKELCLKYDAKVFNFIPPTLEIRFHPHNFLIDNHSFKCLFKLIESHGEGEFMIREEIKKFDGTAKKKEFEKMFLNFSCAEVDKIKAVFNKGKNLWILKPTSMNRGNGIEVINSFEAYKGYVEIRRNKGKNNFESSVIKTMKQMRNQKLLVQKYLEAPLLINARKFDIRMWALVTQDMNFFMFKEGYIRLSSREFSLDDTERFIHLTNNAVQKFGEEYGKFEEGNQLSFSMFKDYVQSRGEELEHVNFDGKIYPRIENLIKMSLNSVKKKINKHRRSNCFEVFGYDFMVDETGKAWLIEVNSNPCLEESSAILKQYIPRMIDDAFKLTIDKIFKPLGEMNDTVFRVDGYDDEENMWKKI